MDAHSLLSNPKRRAGRKKLLIADGNSHALGKKKPESDFVSATSNFSIQYNLSSASVAVAIMRNSGEYPEPAWSFYTLLGLVFAGSVIGMCVMGYLGDLIGRKRALMVTLLLTVAGSAGCAILVWGTDSDVVYGILSLCRFALGVGVGGTYPLSAVTSSEKAGHGEHVGQRVGWAFFWQTPGAMFPYLAAIVLLQYSGPHAVDMQFRLLMGLGAIPAIVVLCAALKQEDSAEFRQQQSKNPLKDVLDQPEYGKTLAGTAGTWFIYDVAFYGTNIFSPQIIESIFGPESLVSMCWHALIAQFIGIPGCLLAIWLVRPKGLYWLNFWGFILLVLLFGALALSYQVYPDGSAVWLKFVLYCLLTCALNFGPNVATYVLPTVCFPTHVKSISHGLSAASAKVGAVVGTFIFQPILSKWGINGVMWMQMLFCLVGALMTYLFVSPTAGMGPSASADSGKFALLPQDGDEGEDLVDGIDTDGSEEPLSLILSTAM